MKKALLVVLSALFLAACATPSSSKVGVATCDRVTNNLLDEIDKIGNPALTDSMKEQLINAKRSWNGISDQAALAKQCTDMEGKMLPLLQQFPKK